MVAKDEIYEGYVNSVRNKLSINKLRINNIEQVITASKNFFSTNKNLIEEQCGIKYEELLNITNITTLKIPATFKNHPLFDLFYTYLKSYVKAKRILNKLNELAKEKILSKEVFDMINNVMDDIIIYEILNGKQLVLNKRQGVIKIKEKKRVFDESLPCRTKVVDWGESENVKQSYAKINFPELYDDYINGRISRKEFNFKLKPYLYSKDNPNGFQWLVYRTQQYSYWWYWSKLNTRLPNYHLYSFVPTVFNNFKINGKQVKPSELHLHIKPEDINKYPIGNIQKLQVMLRLNPNIALKYRDYDI